MAIRPLQVVDLLAGAGGWACAARGLRIAIQLAVDRWDVCCRTYCLNHLGTTVIRGDVRDAAIQQEILAHCSRANPEVVLGGIPCEWLSSHRRLGVNRVTQSERQRERATLGAVLELVRRIAPRYWCLEDVTALRSELPGNLPWREIDAAQYSAQRRKRLYVGQFPPPMIPSPCALRLRDTLRAGPYRIGRRSADRAVAKSNTFRPDTARGVWPDQKSPAICNYGSRHDPEYVLLDSDLRGGRRQLEWQEAAALQGFPADYVFYGSPSDVWKMIGQAVQIDVARAILRAMVRDAERASSPLQKLESAEGPYVSA